MKNKEYLKDKVLNLYNKGYNYKDIAIELNVNPKVACTLISIYSRNKDFKEGFFNVNERECWIFPSA